MKPVRVLVVDSSAPVRNCLSRLLTIEGRMEVVSTAPDPKVAREKIRQFEPDVLTLGMVFGAVNGLVFLSNLMRLRPTPVVVISSLVSGMESLGFDALALGAVDLIRKDPEDPVASLESRANLVAERVFRAAHAHVERLDRTTSERHAVAVQVAPGQRFQRNLVALGASTGGVESLGRMLGALADGLPPIVITQHIPAGFSELFAARVNRQVSFAVKVAEHAEEARRGHVYVAPGDRHLTVRRAGRGYQLLLTEDPPVNRHRPSVDVLFRSVAEQAGSDAVVGLLTGMGEDGARGLLQCRRSGARTFAQDEKTSVVFGMPRAAIEMDAADEIVGLQHIAETILRLVRSG